MNIHELCQKYQVYEADDIRSAWEKYVTDIEDYQTCEYNAAMLDFLGYYFMIKGNKERDIMGSEEAAVDTLINWINAFLKRDGEPCSVSAKKKTRRKAVRAACNKLGFKFHLDFPTKIELSQTNDGQFLCEIHSNIFFGKKAGEITMKYSHDGRFTNDTLALAYAAKCQNTMAYYRIGGLLQKADSDVAKYILSDVLAFNFPGESVVAGDRCYKLNPNMPIYWFYLGAQAGDTHCKHEAALIFRQQNIHSLCAKYMHNLSLFENKYQDEAQKITLEELANQNIPSSIISATQQDRLLNHLVDKYSGNQQVNFSKAALLLLADHAYNLQKYRVSISYYQRAGIASINDTMNFILIERIGTMLYELKENDDALKWLTYAYQMNPNRNVIDMLSDIHEQRWKKTKSIEDAKLAAKYINDGLLTPRKMATLLKMYVEKAIRLNKDIVRDYAKRSLEFLDAETAATIGNQLWSANKEIEDDLPIELLRRAVDLNKTVGRYWQILGVITGYNTLYGKVFSAQKLQMAKECFENARKCGYVSATLHLSDCYWSAQKEEFPQDYKTAKQLLSTLLSSTEDKTLRYLAYMRLSHIARLEKEPINTIVSHLAKAYEANPKGTAAQRFHAFFGRWIGDYAELLNQEGTLQTEIEELFCKNADFIYAVAMQQEVAGAYKTAILLYGCSAKMGNKKALYNLYNMAKPATDYFTKKEAEK